MVSKPSFEFRSVLGAALSQSAALFQMHIGVNLPSLSLPPCPSPLFPFPILPLPLIPLPLLPEAAPLKPARGYGSAASSPCGVGSPGRSRILRTACMLAKRIWLQHF